MDQLALIGQVLLTAVLVGVTAWYAKTTKAIANENREMAAATRESVALAHRQRLDAARPVIVFQLYGGNSDPWVGGFGLRVTNVGVGPALEVSVGLDRSAVTYLPLNEADNWAPPYVIGSGHYLQFVVATPGAPTKQVAADELVTVLRAEYQDVYRQRWISEGELFCSDTPPGSQMVQIRRTDLRRGHRAEDVPHA